MLALRSFPTVFPVLRDRKLSLILLGTGVLLIALFAAGVPLWPCPLLHIAGIPCPGCGLTRATYFLLRGDVRTSLTYHAFAPFALIGLGILGSTGLLPKNAREPWIDKLVALEERSGVVLILLVALILYWLARLVFLNSAFVQLMRG
jgi:Protein of unknown function (DUF2752)